MRRASRFYFWQILALAGAFVDIRTAPAAPRGGKLTIRTVDDETGEPVACRIHLKNPAGKPHIVRKLPHWHDHFLIDGQVALELPRGTYTFEIDRGPEYALASGHFVIEDHADDRHEVRLKRHVHMADEGWWSGDLHIHRPVKHLEQILRAEDLHIAPVITWWNQENAWQKALPPRDAVRRCDGNRYYHLLAGEDERGGGALLYFNLPVPLNLAAAQREFPSSLRHLVAARQHNSAWVEAEKPFWWDLPLWLALGPVDSIGLAHNHLCRDEVLDNEAWGKPRDAQRFRGAWACGEWSQEIYFQVLNCGFRIPPSAGSASGVLPNPVGYNRIYAFVGDDFGYESWWQAFRQGRVMVTNGPLLRPLVNGKLPGHVFRAQAGQTLDLEINLKLSSRDKVRYVEIIKNGRVEHSVPLAELAAGGSLPRVRFSESGWFLVRAVAETEATYRFGATGPYYVEFDEEPPAVSRRAAQFFLDWVDQRTADLEPKLDDPGERREVLDLWRQAREHWQQRLERATRE